MLTALVCRWRASETIGEPIPTFTNLVAHGLQKPRSIVDLLVYFEAFDSILEARAREHSMKRWRRAWKIKLIEEFNPAWADLTDRLNS